MLARKFRVVIIGSLVAIMGMATGLTGESTASAAPAGGSRIAAALHHKGTTLGKHHRSKSKRHAKKHRKSRKHSRRAHVSVKVTKHHAARGA